MTLAKLLSMPLYPKLNWYIKTKVYPQRFGRLEKETQRRNRDALLTTVVVRREGVYKETSV